MISLKDLGEILIKTKKMSIPRLSQIAAISAIAATTILAVQFGFTNIQMYEKNYEVVHQRNLLEVDAARNKATLEVEKAKFDLFRHFVKENADVIKTHSTCLP
jgi:hypothetical protein